MYELTIPLNEEGKPLYEQIYEYIKTQIRERNLPRIWV